MEGVLPALPLPELNETLAKYLSVTKSPTVTCVFKKKNTKKHKIVVNEISPHIFFHFS